MLEHLFGSTTRARLLTFFFSHPSAAYFTREVTRKIRGHLTGVRRELDNLTALRVLTRRGEGRKKYYRVNPEFLLFPDLKQLLFKGQIMVELNLLRRLQRIGRIETVVLTGFFISDERSPTDLLMVGSINRRKLRRLMNTVQRELDHELRYTSMPRREFLFRNDLADRFLYQILEGRKIVVLDRRHLIA